MSEPAPTLPAAQIVDLILGSTMASTVPLAVLVSFLVRKGIVPPQELLQEFESKLDASGLQGEAGELVRPVWANLIAGIKTEVEANG